AAGGVVLALAFRSSVEQEFSYRLDAVLKTIVASVETAPGGGLTMRRPLGDPRFDLLYSGWYWQVTPTDGSALRSRSLWDAAIDVAPGGAEMHTQRTEGPRGESLLVVERDLQFPGQPGLVHVLVAGDLREVSGGVRRFDILLVEALGLLGLGMIVAIVLQVRFGLGPLRAMLADLRAVREGDAPRLAGRYPSEVAPLAEAMNGVLDRDAALIERARTHAGNLAHVLKTPLAVMAAELQGAADKTVLTEQLAAMRRLIEHQLGRAAALAGSGRSLGAKTVVSAVVEGVSQVLAKVHAERDLAFDIDVDPRAVFRGDREDLEEILGNLMENACKLARRRVKVAAREQGGALVLAVEDDGPGMTAEQAAALVGRGKRLDERAPGWGLGLAIVADLVEVNGGALEFSRSELGGLGVFLSFPRAPV
ncbi:MAG: sensor histidine kinase, partial [Dongiaceae bacterium]